MRRVVKIPAKVLEGDAMMRGAALVIPVKVDWPELQLTQDQILDNALAFANGRPQPHEDHSIFNIELPRLK